MLRYMKSRGKVINGLGSSILKVKFNYIKKTSVTNGYTYIKYIKGELISLFFIPGEKKRIKPSKYKKIPSKNRSREKTTF